MHICVLCYENIKHKEEKKTSDDCWGRGTVGKNGQEDNHKS